LHRGRVYAMRLRVNGARGNVTAVNQQPSSQPPFATPAIAGLFSDLIVWQQSSAARSMPQIRGRYALRKSHPGDEFAISSPRLGPTNASDGLAAGGDLNGNAAVAWVQGTAPRRRIVARLVYRSGGGHKFRKFATDVP